jgi:acyl-CoA synthetase (AMP-forming)/AMP-acid ligase II
MEMHYATIIEAMADRFTDEEAIIFGEKRITWKELDERASRLGQAMLDAGIGADDRVGLFLFNCAEYMEAMLAALKIRAVPININYRYTGAELRYLLEDSGARGIIYHSSLTDCVTSGLAQMDLLKLEVVVNDDSTQTTASARDYDQLIADSTPAARITRQESDAFMLYTGGTTGMPKGVVYEIGTMTAGLGNLIARYFGIEIAPTAEQMVERAVELHRSGRCFVSMPASPLMHTAGVMNGGIAMQLLGGRMVILTSRSFDADELWQNIEQEKVNYMVIVGDAFAVSMLRAIDKQRESGHDYDVSSLKAVVSSGVMWSAASKNRFLELGDMMLIDGMGATEGAMAIEISTREKPPAATARFMSLPETRLFDENDQAIAPGSNTPGYIAIGGSLLPKGYYMDAEKSAKTFREIDGKRYGFTGDMGILEEDGTLLFLGRGSGCINTGGEKVYPEEVEEVLKSHPAINDCLVVGVADERFGQKVAAIVEFLQPDANPLTTIKTYSEPLLAAYKLPRIVITVDAIRRGPNGKPDYKWAKEIAEKSTES